MTWREGEVWKEREVTKVMRRKQKKEERDVRNVCNYWRIRQVGVKIIVLVLKRQDNSNLQMLKKKHICCE